jgi:type VII secretion integral membrane protein EccD
MTSSVVSNTCRLTVLTSRVRVDLAVPLGLPVSELLAVVVGRLGADFADEGAAQGGLILQRTGESPLDPGATLAVCGIRDGDLLHLLTAGPKWIATLVTAAIVAVVLLGTAAQLIRSYGLRGSAITSGSFGIAFAALAGAVCVAKDKGLTEFGTQQLLPASGAAVLAAVIAIIAVGSGVPGFVAVVGAGILTAIGAAIAQLSSLGTDSTAALIAAVALAVSPVLPVVSFRLARLPLPLIPTGASDLRADTGSIDARAILNQAVQADQYLSGLVATVAITVGGAAVVLSTGTGSSPWLTGVLAAVLLLRARLFTSRAQRWPLLASAFAPLLTLAFVQVFRQDRLAAVTAFAGVAALVAVILLGCAVFVPGRRYTPPWSRAADVLEALLVLAVIPLALAVMGVYGAVERAAS